MSRGLKPSIVSRLRGRYSRPRAESPAQPLYVHASVGVGATAIGALIAVCVLATKALTDPAVVFGEDGLLRLSAVLIETGAMLAGIGLLTSIARRMFPGAALRRRNL